jgi:hypothetical protein
VSVAISEARALMIARSHHCVRCQEYSYKRVQVKPASPALREELNEVWHAVLVCGVCGLQQELGIDDDGDVLYVA